MATLSNLDIGVLMRMAASAILACSATLHAVAGVGDEPPKASGTAEPAQVIQSQPAAAAGDPAA
jgi:hypothetical protein